MIDCAKAAKTAAPTDTELARLEDWLAGRFLFVDVSKGSSKEAAQALSAECQADLDAQGMPDLNTLLFVELSCELGRPVGGSETEGGAYRAPASIMRGAVAAKTD